MEGASIGAILVKVSGWLPKRVRAADLAGIVLLRIVHTTAANRVSNSLQGCRCIPDFPVGDSMQKKRTDSLAI